MTFFSFPLPRQTKRNAKRTTLLCDLATIALDQLRAGRTDRFLSLGRVVLDAGRGDGLG